MSRKLVLFFSVYGTTGRIAREIARQSGADLKEIEPIVPYDAEREHKETRTRTLLK